MAFEVNISSYGQHSIVILKDNSTNTYAEIYNFGALLNNFTSVHHGQPLNVIDGFSSPVEASEKLTPFFQSAKLSPFVCRVKNAAYKFGEGQYHLTKYTSHSNALHGLIFDVMFTITEHTGDDNAAAVKLEYIYDNKSEGFPFKYKCEVEYRLTEGNALTVTTNITNLDESLIPVTDGWHPYFTFGDKINNYQVEFQSKEMLEFDEALIPTGQLIPYQEFGSLKTFGTTEFDNCFTLDLTECQPLCVVRHPEKKVQLEIHPTEAYPYLQIYTPEHRNSIAIENLSGAPDAYNNAMGLKVMEPNETATFSTKFIVRSI